MSHLLKLFDEWAEMEDDELWATLRKLYGPLLELSLLFPSFQKDRLKNTFAIVVLYLLVFPVHLYLLTVNIKDCIWEDFDLVSLEFHYWLLFTFSLFSVSFMLANRDRIVNVHRCFTSELAKYRTGRIYAEEEPVQFEQEKRQQTIKFMFLPGLIFALAGVSMLVPYIKKMDGTVDYNIHGANMKLPIPGCYPFPTHEGILHVLAVFGQIMAACVTAVIVASLDFMFFRPVQAIIYEYRVLQYGVRTIFSRARRLCKDLYPGLDLKNIDVMNADYQKAVGSCLKDCVAHHYKILYFVSELESMFSLVAGLAVIAGIGVIGLSLVNIVIGMETKNYENVAIFVLFTAAEILSILVLTYFGEIISTQGSVLRDEVYFIDWYDMNMENRKVFLNFQVGITEPLTLKGWGMTDLTLETFSTIMNTAYSFFNLRLKSPGSTDD